MKATKYSWKLCLRVFNLLLVPILCIAANCPNPEKLGPKCWCLDTFYGGSLMCKDLVDPTELYAPVEATVKSRMFAMTIQNSTLRFLPHSLFLKTNYEKIQFVNSELLSFSDGDLAFEGLEKHMTEIRARGANYVTHWDFQQLRKLKKMELIDIHHVYLEAITEKFPEFPELASLSLSFAKLDHISDYAFAKCPKLYIFSLNNNNLKKLKRNILPNPASNLIHLDLSHNKLEILPDDFFTSMPSLKAIYLDGNRLKTVDDRIFMKLFQYIDTLTMKDNQIHCDCRIEWLTKGKRPHTFEAECSAPATLSKIKLQYLRQRQLHCYAYE